MKDKQFTIQKDQRSSASQNLENENRNFVITKRIAKHGKQAVIIVPTLLKDKIKPGDIVEVNLEIIEKGKN